MNRKNLFYKFLFILFIFLILFNYCFRSNIVLAKTYSFESIPDEVLSVRDSSPYYKNPNYDWIIYFYDNSYYSILFIEKTDTLKFYVSDKYNGYWILANETFNGYFYTLNTSYSITSQEKLVNCDWSKTYACGFVSSNTSSLCFSSSRDIYSNNNFNDLFFEGVKPKFIEPYIANTDDDLRNMSSEKCWVFPGSVDVSYYPITFQIQKQYFSGDNYIFDTIYETVLDTDSSFYRSSFFGSDFEFWFEISWSSLGIKFTKNDTYYFRLLYKKDGDILYNDVSRSITMNNGTVQDSFVDGFNNLQDKLNTSTDLILESQKETQNSIEEQTSAIQENTNTNKNIFQKIGDIFNILNPFSKDFFAYKLIELLLNALKSLFIPSDEFFSTYFSDLNSWFSDRFGFLYYPLDLFFELCDRFSNINFDDPIVNIPEIKEPFTKIKLINPIQFNFNTLLEDETLNSVHDIYFIIVDAIIYIGLVILLYKKYEEVITK